MPIPGGASNHFPMNSNQGLKVSLYKYGCYRLTYGYEKSEISGSNQVVHYDSGVTQGNLLPYVSKVSPKSLFLKYFTHHIHYNF